jgi:LPS export ABC transporter protein LptC
LLSGILLCVFACETDLEKVEAIAGDEDYPTLSGKVVEVIYSDSARLKARLIAPKIFRYTFVDEPYYKFPAGMTIFMYNETGTVASKITADHVIYEENEDLWEARGNVVVKDLETGDQLNTELMYWDMEKEKIYSNKFTKVTNEDGIFYGHKGFEANQDFSKWTLIGTKGTVNVEDEF